MKHVNRLVTPHMPVQDKKTVATRVNLNKRNRDTFRKTNTVETQKFETCQHRKKKREAVPWQEKFNGCKQLKKKERMRLDIKENRIEMLKGMLEKMEVFRSDVMAEINQLEGNEEAHVPVAVYPMANIDCFRFHDSPVYQFSYHGSLPPYEGMTKRYIKMMKDYYYMATLKSESVLDLEGEGQPEKPAQEEKAAVIFVHFFKDTKTRDLDNRNKKYILDAIKRTGILEDDSWRHVTLTDMAFLDEGHNHVQVFVVPEKIYPAFYKELNKNHQKFIENKRFEQQFEAFQKTYKLE